MNSVSRTIVFISDGTGITAETLGRGLLSQFDGIEFCYLRFPFTDSMEKAEACLLQLAKIEGARPLIIMTLMDECISARLRTFNALFLDLFGAFIAPMEQELGTASSHSVGLSHSQEHREYASRIAAMNFTLAHDDGILATGLTNADVILVGVSRCGKTPTSLYLAMQFGLKAANYPLIPEDFERDCLPPALLPFKSKLYGLTISPEQLHRIREARRPGSRYASLDNCRQEVAAAEKLMRSGGVEWQDMTSRSIEEMAAHLLQTINLKKAAVRRLN